MARKTRIIAQCPLQQLRRQKLGKLTVNLVPPTLSVTGLSAVLFLWMRYSRSSILGHDGEDPSPLPSSSSSPPSSPSPPSPLCSGEGEGEAETAEGFPTTTPFSSVLARVNMGLEKRGKSPFCISYTVCGNHLLTQPCSCSGCRTCSA